MIDEREVCVYRIVVNTPRMCRHEMFMPGHAGVKHKVSCSPIVNSIPKRPIRKKREFTEMFCAVKIVFFKRKSVIIST